MLLSAKRALDRIDNGTVPAVATGPLGAPSGGRWINENDVIAVNANTSHPQLRVPWMAANDPIRSNTELLGNAVLRSYQLDACNTGNPSPDTFVSGGIEMSCGLGKPFVGGELIRRTRAPAVVVTQHAISVQQWKDHLKEVVGLTNVVTLTDSRVTWTSSKPLPDVTIISYNSLVCAAKMITQHANGMLNDEDSNDTDMHKNRLIGMLHCERFGALILDEVHVSVADHFMAACRLRASVVYGLSGSLIREDTRLSRLNLLIGPVLFSYTSMCTIDYVIITCMMSEEHRALLHTLRGRSVVEYAVRTLNPIKITELKRVVQRHHHDRVIIFCDSRAAAKTLSCIVFGDTSILITGGMQNELRDARIRAFSTSPAGKFVLVSTRVCDAAIDFPDGCIIIQVHVSSASRQQEVQRCGRGTRGNNHVLVYHFVNFATEEEDFTERRTEYMMGQKNTTSNVTRYTVTTSDSESNTPLESLTRMCISIPKQRQNYHRFDRLLRKR